MRVFHLLTKADIQPFPKSITEGRMDEVARFIHNALFLSHSLRRDVIARVTFVGKETYTLEMNSAKIKGLHPDEGSIFGYIRKCFSLFYENKPLPSGVNIKNGFYGDIGIILHEEGDKRVPNKCYFYIGGPNGYPFLPKGEMISLGDVIYTASQTVTIVQYLLDVGIWRGKNC